MTNAQVLATWKLKACLLSPSELEAFSSINIETKETSEPDFNSKLSSIDQMKQIKELDSQLLIAHQELTRLQLENIEHKRKLAPANRRQSHILP